MLVTIADYKTLINKTRTDDQIELGLSAAQDVVQSFLKYPVETEWTQETVPDSIKLAICLVAQSILNNIGVGGLSSQVNLGNGQIQIDNTKYYKYLDFIKAYKKAEIIF